MKDRLRKMNENCMKNMLTKCKEVVKNGVRTRKTLNFCAPPAATLENQTSVRAAALPNIIKEKTKMSDVTIKIKIICEDQRGVFLAEFTPTANELKIICAAERLKKYAMDNYNSLPKEIMLALADVSDCENQIIKQYLKQYEPIDFWFLEENCKKQIYDYLT